MTTPTRLLIVTDRMHAPSVEGKSTAPPFGGKAKPFGSKPQGGASADPIVPDQTDEVVEDAVVEEEIATHEWSGDLIDEGVETPTEPSRAFSSFTGGEGEAAWLDRADDGTLTGWVRDVDGSVYRYSDADAWAVDVDDAGMIRSDGAAVEEEVEDVETDEDDVDVDEDPQPDFLEGKQIVLRAVVRPKDPS